MIFIDTATTEIYTLSLHDALPISRYAPDRSRRRCRRVRHRRHSKLQRRHQRRAAISGEWRCTEREHRSEEHTSELQSQSNLVCRLLLEKKKIDWTGPVAHPLFCAL